MDRRRPLVLVTLAALVTAGCLGSSAIDVPDQLRATGSEAYLIPQGWAYDGKGVSAVDGTIDIDVTDSSNTGQVNAHLTAGNTSFSVLLEDFQGDAPFKDGGIVHGILEHGDSGNGHENIPASFSLSAGWGAGTVMQDGSPMVDPGTGTTNFSIHYMVFQGGVRDDNDHAIYNADRSGTYSPSDPGNADVDPSDREIHLMVKSPGDELNDYSNTFNDTVLEAQYSESYTIPVQSNQSRISVSITLEAASDSVTPGQLDFALSRPDGSTADEVTLGGTDQATTGQLTVEDPTSAGDYTLAVSGSAAQVRYVADTVVSYMQPVSMHFLFEQVEVTPEIDGTPPL